jgi:hypothetical protein
MAQAILRLLQDAGWRERLGRRGAEKIRRDFGLEAYVRGLLELLQPAATSSHSMLVGKG